MCTESKPIVTMLPTLLTPQFVITTTPSATSGDKIGITTALAQTVMYVGSTSALRYCRLDVGPAWAQPTFLSVGLSMYVLHNTTFRPTTYFTTTSILLQLILMSSINLTQIEAGNAPKISTTEEATPTRISTWYASKMSNHVPEWLKGFVRRDNLISAYWFDNHNLRAWPARSFAMWPETQVRKYHSIHGSSIIFHYGMGKHYTKFNGALAKPPLRVGYGWVNISHPVTWM